MDTFKLYFSKQWMAAHFAREDQERLEADLATYFVRKPEIYLATYRQLREHHFRTRRFTWSWNWSAFFAGFAWFFYRKQYVFGTLAVALPVLVDLVGIDIPAAAWTVGFAAISKRIYVVCALARVELANRLGLEDGDRASYLQKHGGVSALAGTLAGIVFGIIILGALAQVYMLERRLGTF